MADAFDAPDAFDAKEANAARAPWSIPRPGLPRRQALVVALLIVAFLGISTTTGTGWPLVLVAILVGTLVAGAMLPPLWLARVEVSVHTPADAAVGVPYELRVVTPPGQSVAARIDELSTGWFRLAPGTLLTTPQARRVLEHVVVELWSTAPLGLWTWRRRLPLSLREPLHIAPPLITVDVPDLRHRLVAGDELTRGVRAYAPGDARRLVHWPATARAGELMVREREVLDHGQVLLVVEFNDDDPSAEARVAWAYSYGLALLADGAAVELVTDEPSGPVRTIVNDKRELGRRLARAVGRR